MTIELGESNEDKDKTVEEFISNLSKKHNENQAKYEKYATETATMYLAPLFEKAKISLTDSELGQSVLWVLVNQIKDTIYFSNSSTFYHGIVEKTGKLLGEAAYTSDDGSVQDSVLALKVPELVEKLVNDSKVLKCLSN